MTNAMSAYEKGLKGILSEAGIPCFVDSRRDIASHPLIGPGEQPAGNVWSMTSDMNLFSLI